mmetsp:Transcript_31779/g.42358  ORF Transcript_31779/g.42358 Transcript_31779/m.42358 type:complete len:442 (+) Transcript_31779:88-1413(+)
MEDTVKNELEILPGPIYNSIHNNKNGNDYEVEMTQKELLDLAIARMLENGQHPPVPVSSPTSSITKGYSRKMHDALSPTRAILPGVFSPITRNNSKLELLSERNADDDDDDDDDIARDVENDSLPPNELFHEDQIGGDGNNNEILIDVPQEDHIIIAVLKHLHKRSWKKKLVTLTFFGIVTWTIIDFIWFGNVQTLFNMFLEWMKLHIISGLFAFMGMFVFATIICIPPTILVLGSGFIFSEAYGMVMGIYMATVTCFIGCCLGAIFAFLRARYMTRDLIILFAERYHIIQKLDSALKEKGFQVMLLLRLSSVVPFNVLNYIGGVTGIQLSSFVFSLVGIIPQIVFTVVIGATAGNISEGKYSGDDELLQSIMLCVGCLFGILALVAIWRLALLELNDEEDDGIEDIPMKMDRRDTLTDATASYDEEDDEEDAGEWFWVWA